MTFVLSSFIKINSKNQAGLEGSLGHLVSRLSWIFEPIYRKKKCQYFLTFYIHLGIKLDFSFRLLKQV